MARIILGVEIKDETEIGFMERDALDDYCLTLQEALISLQGAISGDAAELFFPLEWKLTGCEHRLVKTLLLSPIPFVTADKLMAEISPRSGWGPEGSDEGYSSKNIVSVYVHKVRKKLTDLGFPNAILNKWGYGYGINPIYKTPFKDLGKSHQSAD